MLYPAVVKNFWTRINTKIERFVASETSHPSKNLIRIRRKRFELSAKFVKLPPPPQPPTVKIPFTNSWIRNLNRIATKIQQFVASHTSKFVVSFSSYPAFERQNGNHLGEGNAHE